jgi:hypothetical protein
VHFCSVFGLKIASEIELPELFPGTSDDPPEVTIVAGSVEWRQEAEPGLHADGADLVLIVPEVARFRISGGASIIVEADAGVPERNVRLFLLGSAFGALLHQRGVLPLHANAVEIEGKAVAFMGESGAGKSTLAAWFHDAGYRVLADDVCVVRFDQHGRPRSTPGLPRLRLWLEALNAFGREPSAYNLSYLGDKPFDKFDVPLGSDASGLDDFELGAIYLLDKGDSVRVERIVGVAAAEAVIAHTYRGGFLSAASGYRGHWSSSVALVQTTPIYRLARPWNLGLLREVGEQIVAHVRDQALVP